MWQQLRLLTVFLGVFLHRRHGRALLARVQTSNLDDADRDFVTRILRVTLRLPDALGREQSGPDAPAAPVSRRHTRHAS